MDITAKNRTEAVIAVSVWLRVTRTEARKLLDEHGRDKGETFADWARRVIECERRGA